MTYLSDNIKKRKKRSNYVIFAVVILCLSVAFFFFRKELRVFFQPVLNGYVFTKSTLLIFPEYLERYSTSQKEKEEEIISLKAQVETLENTLKEKEGEDKRLSLLREDLLFTSAPHKTPLIAYPLGVDLTGLYGTIIISKGFKDGVDVGQKVYLRGKQYVCTIQEVSTDRAMCKLLSSYGEKTEGVTSSSSLSITAEGHGGYFIGAIGRGGDVVVGEDVLLKGDPDFTLGKVTKIVQNDQDTSRYVFIRGAYNPVTAHTLYVQKN